MHDHVCQEEPPVLGSPGSTVELCVPLEYYEFPVIDDWHVGPFFRRSGGLLAAQVGSTELWLG